ncbi:fatty acid desaturase [Nioella nitratireducens]|uniref:fatty acid desaturase n=1 Tax=Nioella nitratireducens TaxID=1287720 RepID=UPI0008FD5814|nr:fatty acid desaturase [Nioella nitratireducens]
MDHKTALAALSPARKAALTQRSDREGLRHLAGHVGAMFLCALPILMGWPGWPLALLPLGILTVFLFTLSHECTHYTPFRSRWLNDVVGHVVSLPLVLPFTWFRYYHLAHHKFTNDPERDPELEGGPRPETWTQFLIHLSGWGYWRGMVRTLLANAVGRIDAPYLPVRRHGAMRREARILLALYAGSLASLIWSPLALWLWILPSLIGQPFLRLYLLAEHGRCPPVANMLENSRTTYAGWPVRSIAWNMPFHAEHHSFPNVPFHKLPELNRDLAPLLKSTSDSYPAFAREYVHTLGP